MENQQGCKVGQVLTGPALVNAIQNYAAVRRLVADARPVVIEEGGDENNPLNINSDHPAESGWREDSLPDNLGRLNPSKDWLKETKVPELVIDGVAQFDGKGHPIRAFPFLPRFLSSNLPGKVLEAYFHQDSRIRYEDLWARMPSCTPSLTAAVKNHKYNNKRIREVRAPYHVPCFTARRSTVTRTDIEIASTLSREMIRQATVWPVTPNGIQDPSNRVRYLPLNTFLEPTSQFDQGSEKTWKAMYMYSVLNMIAKVRNASGDYKTLSRRHLPRSWNDRLSGKRARQESETESDDAGKGGKVAPNGATQQSADAERLATESFPRGGKRKSPRNESSPEDKIESSLPLTLQRKNQSGHATEQIMYPRPSYHFSPIVLSSELFEAVATFAERQNQRYQPRRRSNVEPLSSSRAAGTSRPVPKSRTPLNTSQNHTWQPDSRHQQPANEAFFQYGRISTEVGRAPQRSDTWAYGDYADRMACPTPQAQEPRPECRSEETVVEPEPPSHGVPGLDDSEDYNYSSEFVLEEFDNASEIGPFGNL